MYPFRDFDCVIQPDDFHLLQRIFESELARTKLTHKLKRSQKG
ncbi:hypothetical protein [Sinorhizobium fredii]|nr:hypothetical protein [Sinorhizobium fredii]